MLKRLSYRVLHTDLCTTFIQCKCCPISSHIKGVNQDTREEEDHNVTLSTTEKHKLLCLKADKMYRRNAERMQLKYSKAKRKKICTFSVGNFENSKDRQNIYRLTKSSMRSGGSTWKRISPLSTQVCVIL